MSQATPVAKLLETVRAYESGNDIRQMVATSEGGRAYKLLVRREETRAAAEAEKANIENETKKRKQIANIADKYSSASLAEDLEEEFKRQTVGLISAEEFKAKRQAIDDMIRETQQAEKDKKALRVKRTVKAAQLSFEADDIAGSGDEASEDSGSDEDVKIRKKRFGKDPNAKTDFLYDADREAELLRKKKELIVQYKKEQEEVQKQKLEVTFSYWDGSGHRRNCVIEKGYSIGKFLQKAKMELEKSDFPELRTVGSDTLMYVKEDLIIPHNITFYELIKEKARGKSGPLFHFDVHEDIRMANDARVEKDESHAGKIVDRKWYERNKHVFPASRWEMYSREKTYDKYTVHGNVDHSKPVNAVDKSFSCHGVRMAGVPKLPSEHPDPICFGTEAGVLFPEHLCCDDSQFPGGFWRCWDGPFTYENCCQQSSPQCSEHLVSEVWKFLDPDAKTTYRDFWLSDAFYQISRVRNASLACKTAFVASRVLALTKLSWIEQWEVIFSPRRAVDHHNFQLRAIAEAMWALLEEIPLWEFLSAASAEFVLGRLYGHSKKLAYYLLSDGMPLLSGRLPVSDGGSSEFQELLKRRMNLKLPLPLEEARAYLSSSWSLPFGRICALLVLAHEADAAAAAQGRVEAAQEELRKWVDQNDYADLFFSHWPIFRLMLHLHYHLQGRRIVHKEVDVLVLSCAHLPLDGLNWTQPTLDPAGCIEDLHRRVLSGEFHHQRWVLLVNGLWTDVDASMAIGFPTTRNGTWRWPVRQLSGDRDLCFTSYPTGYRGSSGACCIGDTTSGTRAYRYETFASLLSEVEPSGSMASLVLQLDVLGGGAATCMVPPLEEEDYLQATLPAAFVRRHNIESLEVFGELTCFPSANHSEPSRCVTADLTEVMQGLASYCAQSCALWVDAAVGVPLPVAGKVMAGTSGRVRLAGAGLTFQKICAELRMRGVWSAEKYS
ncbi:unnamed protein product [Effrenium voratum]|uniref:FAM50A/XAP5 C-terminal domain-containing protein n=1 Tax=Effrenium voratum TaxID=2562239 RepID=A0AA36JJM0_9DINO|nr:unnamed protein product [Effrenium voratum]